MPDQIDEYQMSIERSCKECNRIYTIKEFFEHNSHYFGRPENYRSGCETYCLACWLGVGPNDFPDSFDTSEQNGGESKNCHESEFDCRVVTDQEFPYGEIYESLIAGDLIRSYSWFLDRNNTEANLVVMPIARMYVDRTIVLPGLVTIYPPEKARLEALIFSKFGGDSCASESASKASGITLELLKHHPVIVFPSYFSWSTFLATNHQVHLELIRRLSTDLDMYCLNFVRYQQCKLSNPDSMPAHAGQVGSKAGIAAALIFNGMVRESRIIGGAAFTHYLTQGLGLSLRQPEWNDFPKNGETGQIVNHALSLYAAILESGNATSQFMQIFSLFEFLASPDKYQGFEDVKKVIARYKAANESEYVHLLDRFYELTGKKEGTQHTGYRTRIVHMGQRIENIVPSQKKRHELFQELDGYIRPVLDHMIQHSDMDFDKYVELRNSLRPFERARSTLK